MLSAKKNKRGNKGLRTHKLTERQSIAAYFSVLTTLSIIAILDNWIADPAPDSTILPHNRQQQAYKTLVYFAIPFIFTASINRFLPGAIPQTLNSVLDVASDAVRIVCKSWNCKRQPKFFASEAGHLAGPQVAGWDEEDVTPEDLKATDPANPPGLVSVDVQPPLIPIEARSIRIKRLMGTASPISYANPLLTQSGAAAPRRSPSREKATREAWALSIFNKTGTTRSTLPKGAHIPKILLDKKRQRRPLASGPKQLPRDTAPLDFLTVNPLQHFNPSPLPPSLPRMVERSSLPRLLRDTYRNTSIKGIGQKRAHLPPTLASAPSTPPESTEPVTAPRPKLILRGRRSKWNSGTLVEKKHRPRPSRMHWLVDDRFPSKRQTETPPPKKQNPLLSLLSKPSIQRSASLSPARRDLSEFGQASPFFKHADKMAAASSKAAKLPLTMPGVVDPDTK